MEDGVSGNDFPNPTSWNRGCKYFIPLEECTSRHTDTNVLKMLMNPFALFVFSQVCYENMEINCLGNRILIEFSSVYLTSKEGQNLKFDFVALVPNQLELSFLRALLHSLQAHHCGGAEANAFHSLQS